MTRNEGGADRAVRAVVGAGLVGATLAGAIGPWGWLGLVLLGSAAMGWCPLYTVLGIDTCGLKR